MQTIPIAIVQTPAFGQLRLGRALLSTLGRVMTPTDELLAEAGARLELLSQSLPVELDAASLSLISKMPLKALSCREALLWRCEELARSAHSSFTSGDVVAGIVLTRAFTESVAGVWYLLELIDRQLENGIEPDLDDRLMRLLMGHRSEVGMPEAVSVLTFIDRIERTVPGLRQAYDDMSEYAHPNWAGTGSAYSQIDRASGITHFGPSNSSTEAHKVLGLSCLNGGLGILEHAYNQLSDSLSRFTDACDQSLRGVKP